MAKKIFVTRRIPDVGITMLREAGFEVDIREGDAPPTEKELIAALGKTSYDGVLCLLTDRIDKNIFDAAPSVTIFANYAAGYDNIDCVESKRRGIVVTNTPGISSDAVAEHTIALVFALTTRLVEGDSYVRAGKYSGWSPTRLVGTDVGGKLIGLVGVGNIGSRVAEMMHLGFGAQVVYYDVTPNTRLEERCGARRRETLEELLREADIVSLHVPLLDSTRHLINEERLRLMKPSAFLVNTSRGPVVDEAMLVKALQDKKIRGAALDVFEFEPRLTPGLTELENVVLTPHIASARESVRNEMARIAAQNIIDFFAGKTPQNAVV